MLSARCLYGRHSTAQRGAGWGWPLSGLLLSHPRCGARPPAVLCTSHFGTSHFGGVPARAERPGACGSGLSPPSSGFGLHFQALPNEAVAALGHPGRGRGAAPARVFGPGAAAAPKASLLSAPQEAWCPRRRWVAPMASVQAVFSTQTPRFPPATCARASDRAGLSKWNLKPPGPPLAQEAATPRK